PPGRYRVRKRESARLLVGDVTLGAGQSTTLRDGDMKASAYAAQTQKGSGLPFGLDAHGPHVSVGVRNGIVDSMGPTSTLLLGYRLRWGVFFAEPRTILRSAQLDISNMTKQYAELDVGGALGLRWRGDRWGGGIAIDSGLVVFDQDALAA